MVGREEEGMFVPGTRYPCYVSMVFKQNNVHCEVLYVGPRPYNTTASKTSLFRLLA